MGTNTRQVSGLTRLFVMLRESLLSNFRVWINQSGCRRAREKVPLNLVMRNSALPSALVMTSGRWSGPGGEACKYSHHNHGVLRTLITNTRTAERGERPPRGTTQYPLCADQAHRGFRGVCHKLGQSDIIQIMQHSAVLQCCSHSRSDMTTLWTVGTRERKFSFFRHFYKINLLFRCIWMKLVTHCLYFAKLSRCLKLEHNLAEPSLTYLT